LLKDTIDLIAELSKSEFKLNVTSNEDAQKQMALRLLLNFTNSQITEFIFCRPDLANVMQQKYFDLFLTMMRILKVCEIEYQMTIEMLKVCGTLINALFFAQFILVFINDESETDLKIDDKDIHEASKLISK
jgi:hypothetical protein